MTLTPRFCTLMLVLALSVTACSEDGSTSGPDHDADQDIEIGTPDDTVGGGAKDLDLVEDFGAPCTENADCLTGFCVEGPDGFVCTQPCLEACPDGYSCKASANTYPDVIFLCIPDVLKHCGPCQNDSQCPGGACLDLTDGLYCAASCETTDDCPSGYQCWDSSNGAKLCTPQNATCTCREDTAGLQKTCSEVGALGTCYGIETCDPAAGWIDCTAALPENEICDYLDNDCDGLIDEDFLFEGAYGSNEHCGACNLSCADGFPNAITTCNYTLDVPKCVVQDCEPGYAKLNDAQCVPSTVGLCEPCATDDQCLLDGSLCTAIGDGTYCTTPCTDTSDCPGGFKCLTLADGVTQCMPESNSCDCSESTTNLSKSCSVTSNMPGAPVATCYGYQECLITGDWGECQVPTETCDGLDNNCDGWIDEGFKDGDTGQYNEVENCGQCGNNCTFLSFENAEPTCDTTQVVPDCAMGCHPNYYDVNNNPADGCECIYQGATDYPDTQGTDENCDGVDGEVLNAVFVAKNGNDANSGTINDPLLTLQAAINMAKANDLRDVYVATGVYVHSVLLLENVSVYGGYRGDFHERNPVLYETVIFGEEGTAQLPGAVNALNINNPPTTIFSGFTIFAATATAAGGSSYAIHLRDCNASLEISHNVIIGGQGGDGVRGDDGIDGGDGNDGAKGASATDCGLNSCTGLNAGGPGGATICETQSLDGGSGGNATCPDYDETGTGSPKVGPTYDQTFTNGENGGDGSGPTPGFGGSAGYDALLWSGESGCGICRTPKLSESSLFLQGSGNHGSNGSDGINGTSGLGCGGPPVIIDGLWTATSGSDGQVGGPGSGGGGGGAGGGVETWNCSQWENSDFGGGGGGGGSGSCAGTGASGGTSGGGSFGIFVLFSVQPGTAPILYGNQIQVGFGGRGGDGGTGGTGGTGGHGAIGGTPGDETANAWCAELGGNGGDGGNGGHGGGGGGGCGGPSYGIFAFGQEGLSVSGYKSTNTFSLSGSAGDGGSGGASIGIPGVEGASGSMNAANF